MNVQSERSSRTGHLLAVESSVPFELLISVWLQLNPINFQQLVRRSRRYERAFFAWETVRKIRNPFFVNGTGFEGYYVGQVCSAHEVAAELLLMGREMLESNARLYRYNPLFRSKLMKTLRGEIEDPNAVEVWAAQFGAALGKLRCRLLANYHARFSSRRLTAIPAFCQRLITSPANSTLRSITRFQRWRSRARWGGGWTLRC